MDNIFKPVERQKAKLRMALTGVSGGGKTLGALYIAYGITGDWGKIALIDTERERGRLYAQRTDFDTEIGQFLYAPLEAPYWPEKYRDYVKQAAAAVGPEGVVIIDSLSHAWSYEGGILELKEQIAARPGKNSYTAWNEAGKEQNILINEILSGDCHTICTMRVKTEYAMETNDKGKQQPIKIGLAPVQREDTEYEFDVVLNIARNHIATTSKDVTFLDNFMEEITPAVGQQLKQWLSEGKEPVRYICDRCGNKIKNSSKVTAQLRASATKEKYGQALCEECTRKQVALDKAMEVTG
ncbi:MAG: AAA family ATPase [Oscillospiraceae bacterium]